MYERTTNITLGLRFVAEKKVPSRSSLTKDNAIFVTKSSRRWVFFTWFPCLTSTGIVGAAPAWLEVRARPFSVYASTQAFLTNCRWWDSRLYLAISASRLDLVRDCISQCSFIMIQFYHPEITFRVKSSRATFSFIKKFAIRVRVTRRIPLRSECDCYLLRETWENRSFKRTRLSRLATSVENRCATRESKVSNSSNERVSSTLRCCSFIKRIVECTAKFFESFCQDCSPFPSMFTNID